MAETLSTEQQARFETDGYLVLEGLLDAEECDLLRAEVDHWCGNAPPVNSRSSFPIRGWRCSPPIRRR